MKKIIRILGSSILTFAMFLVAPKVYAAGDLIIDWGVPSGDPIFVVENMLPGDTEERSIDITNSGTVAHLAGVKSVRTGGTEGLPVFEEILDIVITENDTPIYGTGSVTGAKTLVEFFAESAVEMPLGNIAPTATHTYKFTVYFPHSAGNEYQLRSVIFDLIFGIIRGENIVINEVYYDVDAAHGTDNSTGGTGGNNVIIKGNGAYSINKALIKSLTSCKISQTNNTLINTNIVITNNTGGNNSTGNTGSTTNIFTGGSLTNISINIGGSTNTNNSSCGTGGTSQNNNEWVELYNPTNEDVSLSNWTITDNSTSRTIVGNPIIKAGGFALISKNNSTWNFWNEDPDAVKIELGTDIGNGLDNTGDRLILRDPSNTEIDRMSWGDDTTGFTPNAVNPQVVEGNSTERLTPGLDTDMASDWEKRNPPTPGN